jgi:Ca2+:H+ antiporter
MFPLTTLKARHICPLETLKLATMIRDAQVEDPSIAASGSAAVAPSSGAAGQRHWMGKGPFLFERQPHGRPTGFKATSGKVELCLFVVAVVLTLASPSDWLISLGLPGAVPLFAALFAMMLRTGSSIVRHAELLAGRLGEASGALLVTFSVNLVEIVSISAVVLHGANNPTLLRESLLCGIMLTLNGFVGLTLVMGGRRRREQRFNVQGANSYLSVLLPMAVLTLVLPGFADSNTGSAISVRQTCFIALMCSALYALFLFLQAGPHRRYFEVSASHRQRTSSPQAAGGYLGHAVMLVLDLATVSLLAFQIAKPLDFFSETLRAPLSLSGLALALLVGLPEAIGGVRAALDNRPQAAMNILLGGSLATIGVTVPATLLVALATGRSVELGLHGTNLLMLEMTMLTSVVTFASGRATVLQGAVHLLLFCTFLFLAFQI